MRFASHPPCNCATSASARLCATMLVDGAAIVRCCEWSGWRRSREGALRLKSADCPTRRQAATADVSSLSFLIVPDLAAPRASAPMHQHGEQRDDRPDPTICTSQQRSNDDRSPRDSSPCPTPSPFSSTHAYSLKINLFGMVFVCAVVAAWS